MPTLLWFRRDLRLGDLPALLEAAAKDGQVLGCFVLDPVLEVSSGARRLQFLGDCLRSLRDELDGRLLVTQGRPQERIPAIANAISAAAVHISADFTPFGRRRDENVRAALGDLPLIATGSPYLVSPGRVVKGDDTPYAVFTPYFRRWQEHGWRQPARSGLDLAQWLDPAVLPGAVAASVEIPDPGVDLDLPAGEAAALRHWAEFCEASLADYAESRDRPDLDATSRMSAHLKFGTIHPRTMVADLDRRGDGAAFRRQLAFRDFYAAVPHHWPDSAWRNWNPDFDAIDTDTGADAERLFELGSAARPVFRSSTRGCVSFVKPGSCTTASG